MNTETDITNTIIDTINTIFENLFSSIDNNLYVILDDLVFINSDILSDKYFEKIFGTTTSNGILLISNALLIGFLIYFTIKYVIANFTYSKVESPTQFIFKMIIFGICMNGSYFLIGKILDTTSYISLAIRNIGENLFGKSICFSNLINSINSSISIDSSSINIFSMDGMIKGTITMSLLNLVFSYALRYVMIKVFVLLSPFAFISLSTEATSWFFRAWYKNVFSLLFIQIIVPIVLLILFSMDYSSSDLITKIIYVGAIYALIKANSIVREFTGGISTSVQTNINALKGVGK